jgi:dihydroxyacetone kinase phosphotransfer subunit
VTATIGLVLVSHSEEMAEGLREILAEVAPGVRVAVAAGGPDGVLGTNALAIAGAVEALADLAGVVVLVDLGSAVLSAETALEQLDPALAERVRLADAPFVEGGAAAALAAAGGAGPDGVLQAAEAAWEAPGPL